MSSMIADLMDYVNDLKGSNQDTAYKSVLFPEPATRLGNS
jgi:hypothetical protein